MVFNSHTLVACGTAGGKCFDSTGTGVYTLNALSVKPFHLSASGAFVTERFSVSTT